MGGDQKHTLKSITEEYGALMSPCVNSPTPLRWTERAALSRLHVCVLGVKSISSEERLSRLTRTGVDMVMVVSSNPYAKR